MLASTSLLALVAIAASSVRAQADDADTPSKTATGTVALQTNSCAKVPQIAEAAAIAAALPAQGVIANIMPGDTEAQTIFAAITANATYAAALAYPPSKQVAGAISFTGYAADADTQCWWSVKGCNKPNLPYLPPDYNSCGEPGVWGLSVDDGPGAAHCDLYGLWAQNNIRASLYYIGSQVVAETGAAQEGYNQGHILCVHSWSHNALTSLTNAQVFAELWYTIKAIKMVTGVTTNCWRPPFGDTDDRVRTIAYALGLGAAHLWSDDTNDWKSEEVGGLALAEQSYKDIFGNETATGKGMLVLSHESSPTITKLYIDRFPTIKATFKHSVSAHSCLNVTKPYAEPESPTFPNFVDTIAGKLPTGLVAKADAKAKPLILEGHVYESNPEAGAGQGAAGPARQGDGPDGSDSSGGDVGNAVVVYVTEPAGPRNGTRANAQGQPGTGAASSMTMSTSLWSAAASLLLAIVVVW